MSFNFMSFKRTCFVFFPKIINSVSARKRLGFAVLLIMIDVISTATLPFFSKQIVNDLSLNLSQSLGISVFLLGLLWTIEKTITHVQDIIFFPVINHAIRDLTHQVVAHIHKLPLQVYQTLSMPEILSCLKRISLSARFFIKIVFLLIIPTSLKLIFATCLTIKMTAFGWCLLPSLLFSFFILYKSAQWYLSAREQAWEITDQVTLRINDSIYNSKWVRACYDFESQALNKILQKEANNWYETNTRLQWMHIMIGLLLGLTLTCILFGLVTAIQANQLSVGDFVLLKGQILAAFLPFKTFTIEFRQMAEACVDIKKLTHILDQPIEEHNQPESKQKIESALSLKSISFGYPNQALLINNLSLKISHGEKIIITGSNGSGKSSLLNIMTGLLKPCKGEVHRGNFSLPHFIPQDFRLFNASLKSNLTYGLEEVSEQKLHEVIGFVGLESLIMQRKEGLNILVGELGIRLSRGEQLRIALARMLLKQPQIVFLDETLDALHLTEEAALLKKLFTQIPTWIIVSHHPKIMALGDRMLNLEAGNIVQRNLRKNTYEEIV